ncbi:MAG: hypothetical protein V4692_08265, partial [Bdellovibrionota bacterium]
AEPCDLMALAQGFRIVIGQGEKAGLILLTVAPGSASKVDPNVDPNLVEKSTVDVDADLEAGVSEQGADPADAEMILTELRKSGDFSYIAPKSANELKNELGFDMTAVLSSIDLLELIRVHIQLAMGLSPTTSAYLAHKMGVSLRAPASETAPIVSAAPVTQAVEPVVIQPDSPAVEVGVESEVAVDAPVSM